MVCCWAQNRAVKNLFRSPNFIEDIAVTVQRLERGDLKLRVRALEAERALDRVKVGPSPCRCRAAAEAHTFARPPGR